MSRDPVEESVVELGETDENELVRNPPGKHVRDLSDPMADPSSPPDASSLPPTADR